MKYFSIFNNKPPASWAADIKRDFLTCYSCLYYISMIWPWNIKVYLLKYKRKLKGQKEEKQRMSFYKTQSTHWRVHSKAHHLKIATLRNSSSSLPLCHYCHCFFQPLASLFYSLVSSGIKGHLVHFLSRSLPPPQKTKKFTLKKIPYISGNGTFLL